MTSYAFFFIFIPILASILLVINLIFATHNPYQEKDSPFECGFHSFRGQNRSEFHIDFFFVGFIFLILDVELSLGLPFIVSAYFNTILGLVITVGFFVLLTVAFIYELGKNALNIESRQTNTSKQVHV